MSGGDDLLAVFVEEAAVLLSEIEQITLTLTPGARADDDVAALFRAFHTLKGSSGLVGLTEVAKLTHEVEAVLDRVRAHTRGIDQPLIDALLESRDRLGQMLDRDAAPIAPDDPLLVALRAMRAEAADKPAVKEPWYGDIHGEVVLFADLDLGEPPTNAHEPAPGAAAATSDSAKADAAQAGAAQSGATQSGATTTGEATAEAAASPARGRAEAARADVTVRVSSRKLDALVALVGELVIGQSRLTQLTADTPDPALAANVEALERMVVDLRDGVLGIQMNPVGTVFARFKRLVHDLGKQLGKQVELVTEGGETELDRSVLEQLVDPMLHLVRNAIDHGIESAEVRAARGKPARGTLRLSARHAGQFVLITIDDDGNGLDTDRIRAKAIERGIIPADATMTKDELHQLVFAPGFSTAQAVSQVSGRGVGMDVVKRQVEQLGGDVTLTSELGHGARITLRLPLTLAIVDGLLVEVDHTRYVLPLGLVREAIELDPAQRALSRHRGAIDVRGQLIPFIALRNTFGAAHHEAEDERVVVLEDGARRLGVVVDRVVGQHQTVIQSLGPMLRDVDVVSGATILGDGEVALILDVRGIMQRTLRAAA